MTTFEPCQQTLFDEMECGPSMSSLAASPAKTYLMLASELASKVSDLVCGRSSLDLLARFDLGSQLWKTCQASLVPGMDEFSETWPRSGMMLSGTAYPLPPSAPLTGGTGCGSWPTPRANDAEKRGEIDPTNLRNGLPGAVKMWPTPTANQYESQDMDTLLERRERVKAEKKNGNGFGLTLSQEVMLQERKMWPTPRASEWKGTGPVGSKSHLHRLTKGYLDATVLMEQRTMFATPQARDYRTGSEDRWNDPARSRNLNDQIGGSLNPDWVEWLMGFPLGWTKVDGWKSRKASPASRRASKTAPRG